MRVGYLSALPPEIHYVYALLCREESGTGYVKFGLSKNITARFHSLRSNCPIPARYFAILQVGDRQKSRTVEGALHSKFADRRATGEWFRFDFDNADDKRAFNEGCRSVFINHLGPNFWWEKISISALDAYEKQRRAEFMNSPNRFKAIRKLYYDNAVRSAHRELASYGIKK